MQSLPTPHFPWLSIGCNFYGPYCAREEADGDAARSKVGDHDVLSNICARSIPVTSTPEAGQCTHSSPHLCFSKFLPDRRHGLTSFLLKISKTNSSIVNLARARRLQFFGSSNIFTDESRKDFCTEKSPTD